MRLSVAAALRLALPPEATVAGEAKADIDSVCATGCTVNVAESLSDSGLGPSQVPVTTSVTVTSLSPVFAGAAYVGPRTMADGAKLPSAPPSVQDQEPMLWLVRLSEALANSVAVPPDPTVDGLGGLAVIVRACVTGCTVRAAEPLSESGLGPLQVPVTVRVTVTSPSVALAGAV